jgi:plastocyanin
MSRRFALLLSMLGLLIAGLAAPPATLAGDPCFHSMDRPAPTTGSTASIAIGDCVFAPTVTRVPVGTTVEWTNTSFQAHEVVGAHLAWGAHDKLLEKGDSIGWTFDKPGVFAYSCMLHPGMSGAIVVGDIAATTDSTEPQAAAGAGTTTSPPTSSTSDNGAGIIPAAAVGVAALLAVIVVGLGIRRRQPQPS